MTYATYITACCMYFQEIGFIGYIAMYVATILGLGNISILSSYRNICSVQYQYRQHFAACNNIACAILLQYRHAVIYIHSGYYRIVSTE